MRARMLLRSSMWTREREWDKVRLKMTRKGAGVEDEEAGVDMRYAFYLTK